MWIVAGSIMSRLMMGAICDLVGPRYGSSFLVMIIAPAVFCMALVDDAQGFMICRFFIGYSLATFVSCEYWVSSMFTTSVVGTANGIAAGWGNLGGGATQIIMPLFFSLIRDSFNHPDYTAWRIAFFLPGCMHILLGLLILMFGQDLPDGYHAQLKHHDGDIKEAFTKAIWFAIKSPRAWLFFVLYGYCFGVELTVDNIIAEYFYDRFSLNLHTAGLIAAASGLMNIFSRPIGGFLSDVSSSYAGMRGRLWYFWLVQTLGGVFCIVLGLMNSLGAAIVTMLIFSIFVQAACGASFGIVPFISRRSLGGIIGMTAAGGNLGSVVTQAVFFTSTKYHTETGLVYMGLLIIAVTTLAGLIYFPMWGGMFFKANKAVSEEDYYIREWTQYEQDQGLHLESLKFALNARTERSVRSSPPGSPDPEADNPTADRSGLSMYKSYSH